MTREIKFRAWHEKSEHWCMFTLHDGFTPRFSLETIANLKPWQQYTGLKDKNGKEIYEGDILQDDKQFAPSVVVEWNTMTDHSNWSSSRGNVFEIIGNIYENPELLT